MTNALLEAVHHHTKAAPEDKAFEVQGEEPATYRELWQMASEVARRLLDLTEERDPVMVIGCKSAQTVAAYLGCLMSGHAFVPIDSDLPLARIRAIATQIEGVRAISTLEPADLDSAIAQAAEEASAAADGPVGKPLAHSSLTDMSDIREAVRSHGAPDAPSPDVWVSGEQTQYIIFTSGSTGKPKGIEITANNVANFMRWMDSFPVINEGGRVFLDQASYSFDLSEYELVGALTTGGCLHAVPSKAAHDYAALMKDLKASEVDVWVSTPSFADYCLLSSEFTEEILPSVRMFLFCGEALHRTTAAALAERFPHAMIVNTYGPTESTVAVTFHEVTEADLADTAPLQVGKARPGAVLSIVDHETGEELPAGTRGEIVIAGDTVAKDYYCNPEKTQAAFFKTTMPDGTPTRAYRTGDIGFLDENGELHCEGRLDSLVKVNGFRIELGEVEGTLESLPNVEQAAVVPVNRNGRTRHLRAVVVLHESNPGDAFAEKRRIREGLAKSLPPYMIPRVVTIVDEMPLNANGKIDRKKLAEG